MEAEAEAEAPSEPRVGVLSSDAAANLKATKTWNILNYRPVFMEAKLAGINGKKRKSERERERVSHRFT